MAKTAAKTVRDLRIAAREGNHAAARELLRRDGLDALAAEIKTGRPLPPRVQRAIRAATAGTGSKIELGPWEHVNERGEIENDLLDDVPTRKVHVQFFDDDEQGG